MSDLDIPVFIPTMDITEKKTVYYTSRNIRNEECYMDRPIEEAVKILVRYHCYMCLIMFI